MSQIFAAQLADFGVLSSVPIKYLENFSNPTVYFLTKGKFTRPSTIIVWANASKKAVSVDGLNAIQSASILLSISDLKGEIFTNCTPASCALKRLLR